MGGGLVLVEASDGEESRNSIKDRFFGWRVGVVEGGWHQGRIEARTSASLHSKESSRGGENMSSGPCHKKESTKIRIKMKEERDSILLLAYEHKNIQSSLGPKRNQEKGQSTG